MPTSRALHPIRRVRDALKSAPPEMRLRQYATSAGFAKLLGCSASWIRNVECGITTHWEKLAYRIEEKARVSHKWLLSNPVPDDFIIDINGSIWSPSRSIDPLGPRKGMPDWRELLDKCPDILPKIVARMVEEQLRLDLSHGRQIFLEDIINDFRNSGTFMNKELEAAKCEVREMLESHLGRKVWGEDSATEDRQADHDQPESMGA